jgi:cytochrome oxidase Cu insertion factor (SCO1/SenC/PrrC family)
MRLFSDLMKGKTVIINPFFATCTGVCPPMAKNLERVQDWLGERLGKDVHIISITVDPERDTAPVLKEYAGRFHAKPGWFFLGGRKENVKSVLQRLGQYVEARENHTTLVIIGNLRTGLWKKALGTAPAPGLIKVVESVVNDNGPVTGTGGG